MIRKTGLIAGLMLVFFAPHAGAQEFRAMMSGNVTDPSGAAIPGATVSATNLATNVRSTARSGADGNYVLPQLSPGPYELTVEAAGFQKYKRSGITLSVGDKAVVQVRLEVGQITDSVTVNAELTGVEQNQSVLGQLMDNKKVSELPLNGRQVFMLLQLSAGVVFTQQVFGASGNSGTRAWDISGNFSIQGSRPNTNAFLLDGAPLGVDGKWDYAPLVDAVEEFKVAATATDASQGLTGGGVINMTMKSGTNQFHGLASEFIRNNIFDANSTQTNRAAAQRPDLKKQQHQWNSFAGMVTGPIIKNKLFYAGNYEGFRERVPFPITNTVPTLEQRQGDFSATRNASGALMTVYDPLTTRQSGNQYVRDPFPGNRLPSQRILAVSRNILNYVPLPNIVTNPVTNFNNFASSPNLGLYTYDSFYMKFDYNWNERQRSFASYSQNFGTEYRSQTGFPRGNPARYGPDPNTRAHYGAILDHVWNTTPTTVLNARVSWDRYYMQRKLTSNDSFDASVLGFAGPTGSNPARRFPDLTFTNYVNVGSGVERMFQPNDTYSAVLDVSKAAGRHFVKFGMRTTQARFSRISKGDLDGLYAFNLGFTQRDPQRGDATSGNAIASFLLGYPASGGADVNPASTYENKVFGFYIQDDFKISSRLMLNLGLRWDIQTPSTERFNRAIVGF
ncbi:MAG: carboxypeptidase regulatory-like domain-containing protein, partial [Acidobacteria bacterium]|nr:carboxypeptidase regulatory-like domain-containing protein [Acidobacteriota bacterium]